jgi:cyanophycin synthetase
MKLLKVQALRGPNIWANFEVLEAQVDLEELKESPSDSIPGFNERLMAWLPTMIEHRCSIGERGGFFQRLRNGTYPAHILEHVTIELQRLGGIDVGFGKARGIDEEKGLYYVIVQYEDEDFARECLRTALELYLAAVYDRPFDVQAEIARLRSLCQKICLGPSTDSIVTAAYYRGIPYRRLNDGSLVQLGYGSKQRRIWAASSDNASAIAEAIAKDKELTKTLLRSVGVPVPTGRSVENADDAWAAAQEIGLPVVVKPQYGNHGRGVATNLMSEAQVRAAFNAAREEDRTILVESFAPGLDHRILVVGDKVVAAARREPAKVIGDGQHTVAQLIEIVNQDPRRGEDHGTSLSKIEIDAVALGVLAEQGLTTESTPPAGKTVFIRRNGNLSTGGTATDVTDMVHPDVAAKAVDAARIVGLDIAGVDVVVEDISRPLEEQGGAVVEINAGPGLRMHLDPSEGTPRPVGEAIVDMLFEPGNDGRIPVVAVTGVNGKTTTTRFIAHFLKLEGLCVGMTCTDGIYVGDRRIDDGDCSGPKSAKAVLLNPAVEAAVLETARGGIVREGLGFDKCDVAVVTNIGEGDHLGIGGIDTLEKLAQVKRCIVDVVKRDTGTAVLNAADPLVVEMAEHCKGKVLWFALDGNRPEIVAHREAGGRAVFVRDGFVILAEGSREERFIEVARLPLTHHGRVKFMVENALASVGAAWSLGLSLDLIRRGLETFCANQQMIPGRFNLLEIRGATVIVDYGHNVSALSALLEVIETLPHTRRSAVYSAAGDRRDADMLEQAKLLGSAFDRVYLYEDHYLRGRAEGEILRILREGLAGATRTQLIEEYRGNINAIRRALEVAEPGDLLLLQADVIDETIEFLREYLAAMPGAEQRASAVDAPAGLGHRALANAEVLL